MAISNLYTLKFPSAPPRITELEEIYPHDKPVYPFPKGRSVIEFDSPEMHATTISNIKKIENIHEKVSQLGDAVREGRWDDPLFDEKNENLEGVISKDAFTFPFIALKALRVGEISRRDYFLIQSYFGLRTKYPKERIRAHLLFDQDGNVNENTLKLFESHLCSNLESIKKNSPFTPQKLSRFITNLADYLNRHQLVFFTIADEDLSFAYISSKIWERLSELGHRRFKQSKISLQHPEEIHVMIDKVKQLYPTDGTIAKCFTPDSMSKITFNTGIPDSSFHIFLKC